MRESHSIMLNGRNQTQNTKPGMIHLPKVQRAAKHHPDVTAMADGILPALFHLSHHSPIYSCIYGRSWENLASANLCGLPRLGVLSKNTLLSPYKEQVGWLNELPGVPLGSSRTSALANNTYTRNSLHRI